MFVRYLLDVWAFHLQLNFIYVFILTSDLFCCFDKLLKVIARKVLFISSFLCNDTLLERRVLMRKLELNINNKDYSLMLTRESIKWLEANGFNAADFEKKPITFYDLIWTSLFIANHKDVNPSLAIKLLETYQNSGKNVSSVIKFAIEEYQAFMSALANTDMDELTIIEN